MLKFNGNFGSFAGPRIAERPMSCYHLLYAPKYFHLLNVDDSVNILHQSHTLTLKAVLGGREANGRENVTGRASSHSSLNSFISFFLHQNVFLPNGSSARCLFQQSVIWARSKNYCILTCHLAFHSLFSVLQKEVHLSSKF